MGLHLASCAAYGGRPGCCWFLHNNLAWRRRFRWPGLRYTIDLKQRRIRNDGLQINDIVKFSSLSYLWKEILVFSLLKTRLLHSSFLLSTRGILELQRHSLPCQCSAVQYSTSDVNRDRPYWKIVPQLQHT